MEVIWEPHSSIQVIIWGARNCQVTLNILPYACELCMIIIEIFYDIKIWFGNFVFSNYILYDDTIFTYNTDLLFTYTYDIFTIHKYILIPSNGVIVRKIRRNICSDLSRDFRRMDRLVCRNLPLRASNDVYDFVLVDQHWQGEQYPDQGQCG